MLRLVIDKGVPEDKTYHVTFFPIGKEFDQVATDFMKKVKGEYAAAATIAECLNYAQLPDGFVYAWHFFHPTLKKIHDFPDGYQITEALVERFVEQKPGPYAMSEKPEKPEKPVETKEPEKPAETADDNVNHPKRYTHGKIECIDLIDEMVIGKTPDEAVCVANVVKYMYRYDDKEPVRSLKSAEWYLKRLIAKVEARCGN